MFLYKSTLNTPLYICFNSTVDSRKLHWLNIPLNLILSFLSKYPKPPDIQTQQEPPLFDTIQTSLQVSRVPLSGNEKEQTRFAARKDGSLASASFTLISKTA